jgi:ribosome-associated protein
MTLYFTLSKGDYIELIRLLKALKLASSGGEAKILVDAGDVYLNDVQEFRRRAKVRRGDRVELKSDENNTIILIQ